MFLLLVFLFASSSAHAFYNPSAGRWINRDPIGERGGINLSAFAKNNPTHRWDYLGLTIVRDIPAEIALEIEAGVSIEQIAQDFGLLVSQVLAIIAANELAEAAQEKWDEFSNTSRGKNPCEKAKNALKRLQESLQKHRDKITEHQNKIDNPEAFITDPAILANPQHIQGLIEFWQKQIDTIFQPQVQITEKAIDIANKAVDLACRCWWKPWTWF
jgi:uncharacterized protein RhaS with RHS repeats